jgi:polyhydroxyalkanoate synthesis repressor PhaR
MRPRAAQSSLLHTVLRNEKCPDGRENVIALLRSKHRGSETVTDANTGGTKPEPGKGGKAPGERVVIKKYANRRLYNTGSSSYVTLEHLREMVKQGIDFVVYDAKTNEDITRSVLGQIIFEEENRGQNLLPIQFLRQLITFYGDQMQSLVPSYLEMSLNAFAQQQERLREQFGVSAFGGGDGYAAFQDQVRQNMALFDRAMKMFTPFAYMRPEDSAQPAPAPRPEAPAAAPGAGGEDSLSELKARVEEMQRQIERLASGGR